MTDNCMRLPNGDVLREGEYGRTRGGRKVGPMRPRHEFQSYSWDDGTGTGWQMDGVVGLYCGQNHDDIIARWTDAKPETGTLKQLNVQPGDVVEWMGKRRAGRGIVTYKVATIKGDEYRDTDGDDLVWDDPWRIVSRANPQPAFDPTTNERPFGLLSPAEQEALKAWPHGWERYGQSMTGSAGWRSCQFEPIMSGVYRGKPASIRETVRLGYMRDGAFNEAPATMDLLDGKPDVLSVIRVNTIKQGETNDHATG